MTDGTLALRYHMKGVKGVCPLVGFGATPQGFNTSIPIIATLYDRRRAVEYIYHNWLLYIAAFAVAFGITLFATPLSKTMSTMIGAIDYPKKRGMHSVPIPRMGGIAIVLGFVVTMFVMTFFVDEFRNAEFLGFIVGGIIIVITGILDDIYNIKARTKLMLQIAAAAVVIASGTRIEFVFWPLMTDVSAISVPLTFIWIIGVTNAVNLIDGLDGLAAGVASICALALTVLCIISGSPLAVVLSATLAGSCLGVLPRNFSPAEIFMGDTGALFLGYVLAVASIIGVFKFYAMLSVIIVFFAMALPIFDTLFAMTRRALNGKPIMGADREHLHHRLIDAGFSTTKAVVMLYVLSIVTGAFAVAIAIADLWIILVVAVLALALGMMIIVYRKRISRRQDHTLQSSEPEAVLEAQE